MLIILEYELVIFLSNNREGQASSPGIILDSHLQGEIMAVLSDFSYGWFGFYD